MTKDEDRAQKLLDRIINCNTTTEQDTEFVLLFIDEIRAEAAERALRWVHGFGVELLHYDDKGDDLDPDPALSAAITGKEPL